MGIGSPQRTQASTSPTTQGKVSKETVSFLFINYRGEKNAMGTGPNIYMDFLLHLHRLLKIFPGLPPGRTVSLITVRVD